MTQTAFAHLTAIAAAARAIVAKQEACVALAAIAPEELAALITHIGCLDAANMVLASEIENNADQPDADIPTLDDRLPAAVIEQRNACAAALAAAGFTHVTMTYSGCGDEGNLNDIMAEPSTLDLSDELHTMLSDFGDAFMDAVASGYENGEGGGSDLTFDIVERTFYADVYDNQVERVSSIEEGVALPLGDDAPADADLEPAE